MATSTTLGQRITITEQTVADVRHTAVPIGAQLVLRGTDGSEHGLAPAVQGVLIQALSALAQHGTVTIGELPAELTSTVAADILGVSRPTLMKWAREGVIDSFSVGTHTRFRRDDVLAMVQQRHRERSDALDALRAFDDEHPDLAAD